MKRQDERNPLFEILPLAALSLLGLRILEGQRKMERLFKFLIYAVVGGYLIIIVGLILILTMRYAHGA